MGSLEAIIDSAAQLPLPVSGDRAIDDFERLIVRLCFFSRGTVWYPTWLGWLCLLPMVGALPGVGL